MIRPVTIIWLLLVAAVGYTMFQVKYEVMQQEETLAKLNQQITDGRERVRVLQAEWSYLTRPDRLGRLAQRYLDLTPMSSAQIVPLSAVPERPGAPSALVSDGKAVSPLSIPPVLPATSQPGAAFAAVISGPTP